MIAQLATCSFIERQQNVVFQGFTGSGKSRSLDHPDEGMRSMLLEVLQRRYDTSSTLFGTQYAKKDCQQRLRSGIHAYAIMDRIVHNTIWLDIGHHNMRQRASIEAIRKHRWHPVASTAAAAHHHRQYRVASKPSNTQCAFKKYRLRLNGSGTRHISR